MLGSGWRARLRGALVTMLAATIVATTGTPAFAAPVPGTLTPAADSAAARNAGSNVKLTFTTQHPHVAASTTVSIARPGETPISGSMVEATGTTVSAHFNLDLASPGGYSVHVIDATFDDTCAAPCLRLVADQPTIRSVAPASVGAGATALPFHVEGTEYARGVTVAFYRDGVLDPTVTAVPPGSLTATQIDTTVSVAADAAPGPRDVRVTNTDGQRDECVRCFVVTVPPAATALSPATAGQGAIARTVEVAGSGFVPGLTAALGEGVTVTGIEVRDETSLVLTVGVAGSAPVGPRDLVLTNPDGGTTRLAGAFAVTAAPSVSTLAPATLAGGAVAETVTVTGANLGPATAFAIDGVTITSVTPVDAGTAKLTVNVPSGSLAGVRDIRATNPDDGTSVHAAAFTVAVTPTVTSISPPSLGRGASGELVTITGTDFDPAGVEVAIPGVQVADVTRVDATTITARLSVATTALTGPRDVSVLGLVDRGRASCASCFAVDSFAFDTVTPATVANDTAHVVRIGGVALPPGAELTGTLVRVPAVPGQPPIVASGVVDGAGTSFSAVFDLSHVAPGAYRPVISGTSGGGTCTCLLDVTPATAPTVVGTVPAAVPQGALGRLVTIRGTGFTRGADAAFGPGITKTGPVTFVSPTELRVPVDIDPAAPVGPVAITVTVPGDPAAVTATCADCLAVAARPVPSSLSAPVRGQGAPATTISVGGEGFRPGLSVALSGDGIDVLSAEQKSPQILEVVVAVDETATPGPRTLTVTNTDGGTGSCDCFTVSPGPKPLTVSPGAAGVGDSEVSVAVTGAGFQLDAEIRIAGIAVTGHTPAEGSVEATADLTGVSLGTHAVSVVNPTDGGVGTCACAFVVDAVPAVTGVTPDRRGAGALEFPLTITGTDFSPAAVPSFDDSLAVITRYTVVDATRIDAFARLDVDAEPATRTVVVRNADTSQSGGCECFLVTPGPALTSVSPNSRSVGVGDITVELFGTGFAGSTVDFGAGISAGTPEVTATRIAVQLSVAPDAPIGLRDVVIVNADGGRGTCTCFAVSAVPVVQRVDVTAAERGADLRLHVEGRDFQAAPTVSFGDGITVSEVTREGDSILTVRLAIAADAPLGPRTVTVDNGDGGVATCQACFRVLSTPTVTGITPNVRGRGAPTTTLTVTGTGFDSGAAVAWPPGSGVTTTATRFVSPTTLTVDAFVAKDATLGVMAVTVTNGDGGNGACADCFSVSPAPFVTSVNPNVVQRNRTGMTGTITGGNFVPGPATVSLGDGIVVKSAVATSETSISVTYDVGPFASIDRHPVTVVNPDDGGTGTCTVCFVVSSPRIFTVEAPGDVVSGAAQTFTVTAHVNSSPSSPADTTYTGTPVVAVAEDTHATTGTCTAAVSGVSTCSGFVLGDLGRVLLNVAGSGADADLGGTAKVHVHPTGLEWSPAPPSTGALGQLADFTVRPTVGVEGASIERYGAHRTLVVEGTGANPPSGSALKCDGPVCAFSTMFTQGGVKRLRVVDQSTPARETPMVTLTIPYRTRVTVAARPTTVAGGRTATVSGRFLNAETGAGVGGIPVRVYGRVYPSSSYRPLRTVRTASDGTWRTTFTMNAHTVFYATYPGSPAYLPATSSKSLVAVTTTVTRTAPATGSRLAFGRELVVTGRLTPKQPGSLIYLIERYPNGRLAALARARVARDGTFRLTRKGLARGWHTFYIQVAGTAYTSGGVSPRFTVRVT